jgi:hypothetical protein
MTGGNTSSSVIQDAAPPPLLPLKSAAAALHCPEHLQRNTRSFQNHQQLDYGNSR